MNERQFLALTGLTSGDLKSLTNNNLITPYRSHVPGEKTVVDYPKSQVWKAVAAKALKRQHPNWLWEDVVPEVPKLSSLIDP